MSDAYHKPAFLHTSARRRGGRGAALLLRLAVALDVIDEIVDEQRPRGGLVVLLALRVVRVRQGELEELRPLVEGEALVRDLTRAGESSHEGHAGGVRKQCNCAALASLFGGFARFSSSGFIFTTLHKVLLLQVLTRTPASS